MALTREEHEAAAMLMGRWYANMSNTYFKREETHPHLDADTLKPVSKDEVRRRVRAYRLTIGGNQWAS